jgi:oligoendopeptidase F
MAAQKAKTRPEIPDEMTWDLSKIYRSDDEWKKEYALVKEKMDILLPYKGTLHTSASTLKNFLKAMNRD